MRRNIKLIFILMFSLSIVPVAQAQDIEPEISLDLPEQNATDDPSTAETSEGIVFGSDGDEQVREREVFLVVNVPRTVNFDYDIGEIAVGRPQIASVVVDRPRRRMVVSPLQVGETAILVFDARGVQRDKIQVIVTSQDLDQFIRDLKFLLRDIEGLTARTVGNRVVLEGEVYLREDLDRIEQLIRGNSFVVNLVSLSQDTQRILARRIKNEIKISGVEVDVARDRLVLRGEVATDAEKERAELIARIYIPQADKLVNVISVNPNRQGARPSKLVQVTAHFVELNKSFLRNFNFAWTPIANIQAGLTVPTISGADPWFFSGTLTEFLPRLSTAKALGVARVFQNPSLSVKSGDAASIRSGASIYPFQVAQDANTTSQPGSGEPINIGLDLSVTPTADDRDFVDMTVNVSVRSLGSAAASVQSILINESAINTSHYVRSGETVAIGGVLRSSFVDAKDVPPTQPFVFSPPGGGGSVQVPSSFGNIFQVFKNRTISQDRSMFIVFITPEILVSARDASRELRRQINLESVDPVSAGDEQLRPQ